jgi:hypothetical protein
MELQNMSSKKTGQRLFLIIFVFSFIGYCTAKESNLGLVAKWDDPDHPTKFKLNLPELDHKPSNDEIAFRIVANRVIFALRKGDWELLRKECADTVTLETHMRAYTQDLSPKQIKQLFPDDADDNADFNIAISGSFINTKKPISEKMKKHFMSFCDWVKETYDWPTPPVDVGLNLRFGDLEYLFGPAIEGKVCSNEYWSIRLEMVDGIWRVRSLIMDLH